MKFARKFGGTSNEMTMKNKNMFLSDSNVIAIYTVSRILLQMKEQLGLEVMLEYLQQYNTTIEKNNPQLKSTVQHALSMVSIDKIYEDMMSRGAQEEK